MIHAVPAVSIPLVHVEQRHFAGALHVGDEGEALHRLVEIRDARGAAGIIASHAVCGAVVLEHFTLTPARSHFVGKERAQGSPYYFTSRWRVSMGRTPCIKVTQQIAVKLDHDRNAGRGPLRCQERFMSPLIDYGDSGIHRRQSLVRRHVKPLAAFPELTEKAMSDLLDDARPTWHPDNVAKLHRAPTRRGHLLDASLWVAAHPDLDQAPADGTGDIDAIHDRTSLDALSGQCLGLSHSLSTNRRNISARPGRSACLFRISSSFSNSRSETRIGKIFRFSLMPLTLPQHKRNRKIKSISTIHRYRETMYCILRYTGLYSTHQTGRDSPCHGKPALGRAV